MCHESGADFRAGRSGSLKKNAHADVTLLDPNLEWDFDVKRSKSKSRNTPFHGRQMHGATVATIVGGRVAYLRPDYTRINEPKQRHPCLNDEGAGPAVSSRRDPAPDCCSCS